MNDDRERELCLKWIILFFLPLSFLLRHDGGNLEMRDEIGINEMRMNNKIFLVVIFIRATARAAGTEQSSLGQGPRKRPSRPRRSWSGSSFTEAVS